MEAPLSVRTADAPTLVLYGPEDHVIPRDFMARMEAAFPDRAGPFVVEGAGHFLQWERADALNGALRLLVSGRHAADRPADLASAPPAGWRPPSSWRSRARPA